MKKVIIPFDGGHYSEGAYAFIKKMHNISPVELTGVFLPSVVYARLVLLPAAMSAPVYFPAEEEYDDEKKGKKQVQRSQVIEVEEIELRNVSDNNLINEDNA